MNISNKKEALLLFIGDIFFFLTSLYISLFLRYGEAPNSKILHEHVIPFSILLIIWILIFYIAGLYDKRTLILKSRLPIVIFNAQVTNSILAVIFFYLLPVFGITPKTILFLYLFLSFTLVVLWRIYVNTLFKNVEKQPALLIGSGAEMHELLNEVNRSDRSIIHFVSSIDVKNITSLDIQEEIIKRVYVEDIKCIAIDFSDEKIAPLLPHLYNLIFSKVRFIDSHKIYEDVFDRIPLSLVTYSWFLENISVSPKFTYDFLKRLMDIFLSFILGALSLVLYPFVYIAVKLDDQGKIFIFQDRIGQNNIPVSIIKFRTMLVDDGGEGLADRHVQVTRVGSFLRMTRIDELPQLWNVLMGDISLIGPRPELPNLVKLYEKEISFYNVRHLIKPGLSGWAQLYQKTPPKFATDYDQTKVKLSYDLFYIKNRSFLLDLKIALKTVKILLSRSGV
jgi:lipopolysaccharide/colanic/teichoic acid biosynthesis glycosyltransferase